jgi:DNA-3-methyladenine glycosylase II
MDAATTKARRLDRKIESRLALTDPALSRVIDAVVARIGIQRIPPSRATPFEALVRAIVYQSISGAAAATVFARFKEDLGARLTPETVAARRLPSLTKAGLSGGKARTIRRVAAWFLSNPELAKELAKLSNEEIFEVLTALPGVGAWTVEVLLIFNLGRLDISPTADHSIRRGVTLAYGLRALASAREVADRSTAWQPYRSIAAIYLRQAAKLKLSRGDLKRRKT